jgi:hypothetical protein
VARWVALPPALSLDACFRAKMARTDPPQAGTSCVAANAPYCVRRVLRAFKSLNLLKVLVAADSRPHIRCGSGLRSDVLQGAKRLQTVIVGCRLPVGCGFGVCSLPGRSRAAWPTAGLRRSGLMSFAALLGKSSTWLAQSAVSQRSVARGGCGFGP